MIVLHLLSRDDVAEAQSLVTERHYLRKPVDVRCSVEGYRVATGLRTVGVFLFGRPQAQRCYPWYGSLEDVAAGKASCSRWSVLNLARVWFDPAVQPGGNLHTPAYVPGFTDRHGAFRSKLGSATIQALADRVVLDYLLRRPPCFLEEPYELRWLLSYCDRRLHRGALYRAAGFELFRTNEDGIETWRLPLRPLTADEHEQVRAASLRSPRSNAYRERRAFAAMLSAAGASC